MKVIDVDIECVRHRKFLVEVGGWWQTNYIQCRQDSPAMTCQLTLCIKFYF